MISRHAPIYHDLFLDEAGEEHPVRYRVFEAYAEDFDLVFRAMGQLDLSRGDTIPILVFQEPSSTQVQSIPTHIPWLATSGTLARDLELLREALISPLAPLGMIGVDFADFQIASNAGGEVKVSLLHVADLEDLAAAIRRLGTDPMHAWDPPASCCAHLRVPLDLAMTDIDSLILTLEIHIGSPFMVIALHREDIRHFQLSLIRFTGRSR